MSLKCPHCQNADLSKLQYREQIPSYRKLNSLEDGKLTVSLESEDDYESADGSELFCTDCYEAFPIPDDLVVDFGD